MQTHTLDFTIEMPNGFSYDLTSSLVTDWDAETVQSWAKASLTDFTYHSHGEITVTAATLDGYEFSEGELEALEAGTLARMSDA